MEPGWAISVHCLLSRLGLLQLCGLQCVYDWTAEGWGTGTFCGDFSPIYHTLYAFSKPIFVAELGVEIQENQQKYLADALRYGSTYPLLSAMIYFNAVDSVSVGGVTPNWSIPVRDW